MLLFAPDSIQVPPPFLISEVGAVVEITPEIVPVLPVAPSKIRAYETKFTAPLQIIVPEVPAAVMVASDPKVMGQTMVEAVAEVLVNAPAGDVVNPAPFKVMASV